MRTTISLGAFKSPAQVLATMAKHSEHIPDEKIRSLNLQPVIYKLVSEGMPLLEALKRIACYREFLYLCKTYKGKIPIIPSKRIDLVWHTHIEITGIYDDQCFEALGFKLHHFPFLGTRGKKDLELLHVQAENTRELIRLHFGKDLWYKKTKDAALCGPASCKDKDDDAYPDISLLFSLHPATAAA